SDIEYQSYFPTTTKKSSDEVEIELIDKFLTDYFNLSPKINLRECYDRWSMADKHFAKIACQFKGIRILRQDPVENLFCFICSTNNNIIRISQMLGFGYRAKYITQTAKYLTENYSDGEKWLSSLRNVDYKEAHSALLKLSGCLMSLDKHNAIPIDTHVWQIAKREYGFNTKGTATKTLTTRLYEAIGDHFRNLFGDYTFQDRQSFTAIDTMFKSDLSKSELDSSGLIESDQIVITKKKSRSKNIQEESILL
ncbi:9533_t:CDS:2, partial [Racocetra fulgida]